MRSRILLLLFIAIIAADLFAQSPQAKRLISLDAKQRTFVDGKTLVKEVLLSGLDEKYDNSDHLIQDPIYESDVRFELGQSRGPIQANERFDLDKVGNAIAIIKEYLFQKGYFSAKVIAFGKKLAPNEMAVILSIERGPKGTITGVRFHGMIVFAEDELRSVLANCLGSAWGEYKPRFIDFCAQKEVRGYMWDRGYLQAKISAPSRKFGEETVEVHFQVNEGIRYRFGEISVTGNKLLTDREILEILEVSTGDVANVKNLRNFPSSKLVDIYKNNGHVLMSAELEPKFLPPKMEGLDGIVNIEFLIDEGPQFKFGNVTFIGVDDKVASELKTDFPLRRGDVYSQKELDDYIKKLNESGQFKPIDPESDVEVLTLEEVPPEPSTEGKLTLKSPRSERRNDIDLTVRITRKIN